MKKVFFVILFASIVFLSGCDSISLDQLQELEDDIAAIEDFDDEALLSSIAALEAEIEDLEADLVLLGDEDTTLLATISSLEDEIVILEGQLALIGATFDDVPATVYVKYGDDLDLLTLGVTAVDALDGDVSIDITVNILDTTVLTIGEYDIIYSVDDSDGNTTSMAS
jgi:hypothetical protein